MNHIKTVAASLTDIHKIKNLKRNLYTCTAVNNTGNKANHRNLNKK
jgi:hypothetical protein